MLPMDTLHPLPEQLRFLIEPAARYGQVGPSFMPDLSWTSLDDLSASDLSTLSLLFSRVHQPDAVRALFEWLHQSENDADASQPHSVRTQIVNLIGIFEVLRRKQIKPFEKLRDPTKRRPSVEPFDMPTSIAFLKDLAGRFGDVVREHGESGAQAIYRRLNDRTKQHLSEAAARVRKEGLYRRIILPYVADISTPTQSRLYGLCGFLDLNGLDLE